MSSTERGFLAKLREERAKLQPPPYLRQKTLDSIEAEEKLKNRIERERTKSLNHLHRSRFPALLDELGDLVMGTVIQGRDFFEHREDLRVPRSQEAIPLLIPVSEESVLSTLLWDVEQDDEQPGFFGAKAVIIEAFPQGDIFVYGNPLWGTSHSTLKERSSNKSLQEKMLEKAYQAPKIAFYYFNGENEQRLIYHSQDQEEAISF